MDRLNLPKHIVERVERRWAQKLQEQAAAWKSSKPEARGVTATGVPVVYSRRSRHHDEALKRFAKLR